MDFTAAKITNVDDTVRSYWKVNICSIGFDIFTSSNMQEISAGYIINLKAYSNLDSTL